MPATDPKQQLIAMPARQTVETRSRKYFFRIVAQRVDDDDDDDDDGDDDDDDDMWTAAKVVEKD